MMGQGAFSSEQNGSYCCWRVARVVPVTDDKELKKGQQRLGIAIAGIVFVFDDLLHGLAAPKAEHLRADRK